MTNPTLERAARAAARAFYEGEALDEPIFFETYGGRSVDELVEGFWREFVPEARAVLMAVREPDEEFHEKAAQAVNAPPYYDSHFTAVIDALLEIP